MELKTLLRLFLVLLLLMGAAAGYGWYRLNRPYGAFQQPVMVDFPEGTSTGRMARILASKGVVEDARLFELARAISPRAVLQAGEYKFAQPASALEVFRRIERGDVFYEVLVVPEGHNLFDIEGDLEPLGLIKPEEFLKTAKNPALIRDLDPAAQSLEGYLFPDSYRINGHTTAQILCRTMVGRFREQWKLLGSPADAHRIVTMASLVEREARLPQDRPAIASVFYNRLRLGMRLDCDPTTVYAALLENRYRGKIYKSDLASGNPYNTYVNAGLPPGPIANPGVSSLKAALKPADTDYLYFVAKVDGSGGHTFSKDLTAHLAAAAVLREAEAAAKQNLVR